jgi:hypothetical protein
MASEEQKFLHSQRILKKDASIRRQTKIAKTFGVDRYIKEPHRMAKHHALDCGQAGCMVCSNSRKTNGERTVQEKRMFQDKLHFESNEHLVDHVEEPWEEERGNENFGHLIEAYKKETAFKR